MNTVLTGTRYGKLIVVGDYLPKSSKLKTKYATILCKCDCGTEKRIGVHNLRHGKTVSCGCFRVLNSSKMGKTFGTQSANSRRKYGLVESSARDLYTKYMARNPGNLPFEDFHKLTQLPCYYCNDKPNQVYIKHSPANKNDGYGYIYNGLDRLDNNIGYDKLNVRPCCGPCNFMRNKMSTDSFYEQMIKIIQNHEDEFRKFGVVLNTKHQIKLKSNDTQLFRIIELLKFVLTLDDPELTKSTVESVIELLEEIK